jgi:hypothetical protein
MKVRLSSGTPGINRKRRLFADLAMARISFLRNDEKATEWKKNMPVGAWLELVTQARNIVVQKSLTLPVVG